MIMFYWWQGLTYTAAANVSQMGVIIGVSTLLVNVQNAALRNALNVGKNLVLKLSHSALFAQGVKG